MNIQSNLKYIYVPCPSYVLYTLPPGLNLSPHIIRALWHLAKENSQVGVSVGGAVGRGILSA